MSHLTRLSRTATFVAALGSIAMTAACSNPERVPAAQRQAIADSLRRLVTEAYDFSKPEPVKRLLSLYPDSGRVISAAAGRVSTSRQQLQTEIGGFWQRVGQNMKGPRFVLGSSYVDVISPNAVVMTFTYGIPHHTPTGAPHTVTGAWTTLWRRQNGRWMIVQEHLSDTPESTAPSSPAVAPPASPQ
jgi:ketosteroid isomerase-like protein